MATTSMSVSERGKVRRVIIVGGGVAGLVTVIKLCEAGVPVLLLSPTPSLRSHSVCAPDGIDACLHAAGEDDDPRVHFEETIAAGDFLAHQPPVRGMTEAAPDVVHLLDRMGVPFNRTPEGRVAVRRSVGSRLSRTAFAGSSTAAQILRALDDQVCRWEAENVLDSRGLVVPGERLVRRLEGWEFVRLVRDDHGVAVGVVAQNLRSSKIEAFPGDAVCLATGGPGALFGNSASSLLSTGMASAICYQQGAVYANGEFIQVHPTAVAGPDKLLVVSEGARALGGRLWVPKDPGDHRSPREIPNRERDYFLERKYPGFGNLVPSDVAARAMLRTARHARHDGSGSPEAYLDLTHLDPAVVRARLASALDVCRKLTGQDPLTQPTPVRPAVTGSTGGLWVDYEAREDGTIVVGSPRNHATSIPGLYAVGEAACQYHGANRLEGNALLGSVYGGMLTGRAIVAYRSAMARSAFDLPSSLFDKPRDHETGLFDEIMARAQSEQDTENPFVLRAELGELMLRDCTIERRNDSLRQLAGKLDELDQRARRVRLTDRALRANQSAAAVRSLQNMLVLARVITLGALGREECRGSHYKLDCDPTRTPGAVGRDDGSWLRTTLAVHRAPGEVGFLREFDYDCVGAPVHVTDQVDVRLMRPRPREYGRDQSSW